MLVMPRKKLSQNPLMVVTPISKAIAVLLFLLLPLLGFFVGVSYQDKILAP